MKLLFLILISFPVLACNNPISIIEAQKAIEGLPANGHDCKVGQRDCLCYDTVEWKAGEIVDNFVKGEPIYTVNSQVACVDEADCILKQSELLCDEGFTSAYRLDNPQAYCFKLEGYEQILQGKKLQNNVTKLAQLKSEREAEDNNQRQKQVAKRAARKALKEANIDGANTIASLRQIVKALMLAIEDD